MDTPAPRFENDDQAAQHWLTVLRDGAREQKIQAREQLAAIFERRSMLEEATDLLIANIENGVRGADIYRWLARLYRNQGDEILAMQAAAEAAKYMPPAQPTRPPDSVTRMEEPRGPANERICASCGYENRLRRSTCKRCHTPLPAISPTLPTAQATSVTARTASARGKVRPWYLSTAAILLASGLCFPPLAMVLVWLRPWTRGAKIGASILLVVWGLFLLGSLRPMTGAQFANRSSTLPTPTLRPATTVPASTFTPIVVQAPTSVPTPRPRAPTATPAPPPIAIVFTGRFDPAVLRTGQKLVVELGIENKSERSLEAIRIFSNGPWDKYTIVNVLPSGRHESSWLGHNFYASMTIPPGQRRAVSIVAYPNEPGNHDFSFIPHAGSLTLKDEKGENIVIGGKVSVIR